MLASLSRRCDSEVWTVRRTHREDRNKWMDKPAEDPFQRSRDAQKKGMQALQGTGGGISLAWRSHIFSGPGAGNSCRVLGVKKGGWEIAQLTAAVSY